MSTYVFISHLNRMVLLNVLHEETVNVSLLIFRKENIPYHNLTM